MFSKIFNVSEHFWGYQYSTFLRKKQLNLNHILGGEGVLDLIFNEKYLEKYLGVRGWGSFGRISESTLVLFVLVYGVGG